MENNWLTRFLVNKYGGKLTLDDLNAAKRILETKCLVGLTEDLDMSVERFERYFGWDLDTKGRGCRGAILKEGDKRLEVKHMIPKGTPAYEALFAQNRFDMELYKFVKELFVKQGKMPELGIAISDGKK